MAASQPAHDQTPSWTSATEPSCLFMHVSSGTRADISRTSQQTTASLVSGIACSSNTATRNGMGLLCRQDHTAMGSVICHEAPQVDTPKLMQILCSDLARTLWLDVYWSKAEVNRTSPFRWVLTLFWLGSLFTEARAPTWSIQLPFGFHEASPSKLPSFLPVRTHRQTMRTKEQLHVKSER